MSDPLARFARVEVAVVCADGTRYAMILADDPLRELSGTVDCQYPEGGGRASGYVKLSGLVEKFERVPVGQAAPSDPPRPPCQEEPPAILPVPGAEHAHWCRYAREPHVWHRCHGCILEWKLADPVAAGSAE